MWQEVLIRKALPPSEVRLAMIIQQDNLTEKALASIKEYEDSNRELPLEYRKVMNNLRRMTPEDGLKRVLDSFPIPSKMSDEKIMENYKKILNAGTLRSHDNVEQIVDAGLKAHAEGDMEKFERIKSKIISLPPLSKDQRSKNKKLVSKLSYLKSLSPSWTLKFSNPEGEGMEKPNFKAHVAEFVEESNKVLAKLHMGDTKPKLSIENDEIITHVSNPNDFMKFIKDNEEIKLLYVSNLRPYGPDLQSTKDITTNLSELDAFIGQNKQMTPIDLTTYTHVRDYLSALAAISGDIKKFIPTKLKNGNTYPQNAILNRTSENTRSLILNPYLDIILGSTFDTNWYDKLFEGIRMRGFTSDDLSRSIVEKDIYDGLVGASGATQSTYGVNLNLFSDLEGKLGGTEKAALKKIREYIKTYPTVGTEIDRFADTYQRNRLSELQQYFTLSEITSIKEWWESLDEETKEDIEEELGDFDIKYKTYDGKEFISNKFLEKAYGVIVFGREEHGPDDFNKALQNIKEFLEVDDVGFGEKQQAFRKLRSVMFSESKGTSSFTNLLLSFPKDELTKLVNTKQESANYMEKLSPENSLQFLSKLSHHVTLSGVDVAATFKAMDGVEEDKKSELAEELNKGMPSFLNEARKQLIEGFDLTLKDFAKNPENFNTERKFGNTIRSSAIVAKETFTELKLLRE